MIWCSFLVLILLLHGVSSQESIVRQVGDHKLHVHHYLHEAHDLLEEHLTRAMENPRPFKAGERKPVVLVAPMTGSLIKAKLDKSKDDPSAGFFCSKNSDWYVLFAGTDPRNWEAMQTMLPQKYKCTFENLKFQYDMATGLSSPIHGVETKIPGESEDSLGNEEALVSFTDVVIPTFTAYGYTAHVDLFFAPYDFRYAANNYIQKEYPILRDMVENIHNATGQKVSFQGVSMGGPFMDAFFQTVSQTWKDKYVDIFVSFCGVFQGSVYNLGVIINGEDYGIPYIDKELFADFYKTWQSSVWLTPFDEDDRIVAMTPSTNYKISEIPELLERGKAFDAADMKRKYYNKNSWRTDVDPGVKTLCAFSSTIPTAQVLRWTTDDINGIGENRDDIMGTGDGVGHYASLRSCETWDGVEIMEYDEVTHGFEVAIPDFTKYSIEYINGFKTCGADETYWVCQYACGEKNGQCIQPRPANEQVYELTTGTCEPDKALMEEECRREAGGNFFEQKVSGRFPAGCYTEGSSFIFNQMTEGIDCSATYPCVCFTNPRTDGIPKRMLQWDLKPQRATNSTLIDAAVDESTRRKP